MLAGPASGHPASGHPASGHPASGHPASGHPASGHPASGPHGVVKVVDFGLAKRHEDRGAAQSEGSQTLTGAVMGTAAYMSPEQAEGRTADARSDVFSFGALLYEMLSGRRAFGGESAAAAMAAVLRDQPEPLDSPVWSIVAQCLEKDAARRFQTAGELRTALEALRAGGRPGKRRRARRRRWPVLVIAGMAAAAAIGLLLWRERSPEPARSLLALTLDTGLTTEPALSRDGRMLAYASDRNSDHLEIWVQPLEGGPARRLTNGPTDQHEPAWSPDRSTICYRSEAQGGGLWTIPVAGGTPKLMMRGGRSGQYSPDGQWIACWTGLPGIGDPDAPGNARMFLLAAGGGPPRPLAPDFTARNPVWTPDSRHILFAGTPAGDPDSHDWWIADLASGRTTRTGALETLARAHVDLSSLSGPGEWSAESGGVLFSAGREGPANIWVLPISPRTWKTAALPVRVNVSTAPEEFPTAGGGRIVFASTDSRWNTWSLRDGQLQPVTDRNSHSVSLSLSADGDRMVGVEMSGPVAHDLRSGASWQLGQHATWARIQPGGEVLVLAQLQGRVTLHSIPFEGGQPTPRAAANFNQKIWDLSPDARTLLGMTATAPRGVAAIDMATGRAQVLLSHPVWNLYWAVVSPDGTRVAFTARSGPEQSRIFAAPFRPGASTEIGEWIPVTDGLSNDTGPRWSPDGQRVYYFSDRDGFRCIWSVEFRNGRAGPPQAVRHFHESRHSLGGVPVAQLPLGVARNRLVFSVCEPAGNIYLAK